MTRATLRARMRLITWSLAVVLIVAMLAKVGEIGLIKVPAVDTKEIGKAVYDFLKDMAVVIVTIAAAYLAAILQRRSNFIESLEAQWREIVQTKSRLFAYCERPSPGTEDYVTAFCCISETIDTMRIVYCNVGETNEKIGLYPYTPLHDMRRALQTLDPSKKQHFTESERKLVRDAILQSFYALRETFLEELDLEEPARPLLVAAAQRVKRAGAPPRALSAQSEQLAEQGQLPRARPDVDQLLKQQWDREHQGANPGNGGNVQNQMSGN